MRMARAVMATAEAELAAAGYTRGPLEWIAAVHRDTAHPHVHILLRARAGGRDFRLPRTLKYYDLRRAAQLALSQELGLAPPAWALEPQQRRSMGGLSR
jgi:hypothetical protein